MRYPQNPSANYQRSNGFLYLGYGIDPIPAVTPTQRWTDWRVYRGKQPVLGIFRKRADSDVRPNAQRAIDEAPRRRGPIGSNSTAAGCDR